MITFSFSLPPQFFFNVSRFSSKSSMLLILLRCETCKQVKSTLRYRGGQRSSLCTQHIFRMCLQKGKVCFSDSSQRSWESFVTLQLHQKNGKLIKIHFQKLLICYQNYHNHLGNRLLFLIIPVQFSSFFLVHFFPQRFIH